MHNNETFRFVENEVGSIENWMKYWINSVSLHWNNNFTTMKRLDLMKFRSCFFFIENWINNWFSAFNSQLHLNLVMKSTGKFTSIELWAQPLKLELGRDWKRSSGWNDVITMNWWVIWADVRWKCDGTWHWSAKFMFQLGLGHQTPVSLEFNSWFVGELR